MASRVNLKFVFGLGSVLVLIAIVVAYFGLRNWMAPGVEQNIERGRQAEKENDLKRAISFYGRAVNKDRGNLDAIKIWLGAIERYTPPARQAYEDMYYGEYMGAIRAVAMADRKNPAAFRRFLDERYKWTERAMPSLRGWESYAKEYDELMKSFQGDEAAKNSLRRYRALARAGILANNPELGETAIKEGIEDLNAALAADPADADVVIALSSMERALADRAARVGRQSEADKTLAAIRARLEKFVADHPDAQRARFAILADDIGATVREMSKSTEPGTMLDALKANKAGIDAMAEAIKAQPPEKTDASIALGIAPWVLAIAGTPADPNAGAKPMDALLTHVQQGHTTDPAFLLGRVRLESGRGQFEKAIDLCKQAIALPDKPMSLDGLLLHGTRSRAMLMQADSTFAWWEQEKDPAKREEYLAQIRALRKDLAAREGESAAWVLGIDGRLALASGDIPGARTTISAYNDQTQQTDTTMLMLEAELLTRIGQKGAAKTKLERVLQLDKQSVRALRSLALIEADERDWTSAAKHLGEASSLRPDDKGLKDLFDHAVQLARGKFDSDPVVGIILKAQEAMMGTTGDINKTNKILRDALAEEKFAGDVRISLMLAQNLAVAKDIPGAKAVLEECVRKNPTNALVKSVLERIDKDPLQMYLEQIDQAGITPVQKWLMKYGTYMRAGKPEDGRRALAEAAKLEPDNPAVIDSQFDDAIMRRDEADQDRILAKARTLNLDRAGGALYQSRALVSRGKVAEAIGGFREVVTKDKQNMLAWRLLGMALLEQRRYGEAIDALKTAVGIKPDDIPSITSYLQALVSAKREGEALILARKAENVAGADPTFFEMYLLLEASAPGGDKNKAIAARQRQAQRAPDDRANKARLATLLVNSGKMKEAGDLIKELRTSDPKDEICLQIEAAFLGRQGNVAGAVKLLRDHILSLDPKDRKAELYINNSRLLRQLGQPDEAKRTLEEARPVQDPKTALIDRELGDMMYEMGNSVQEPTPEKAKEKALGYFNASLDAYQKALDGGGPDSENAIRKRMIEVCLKAENYPRMAKIIADLPPSAQGEATVLLLQAEAAAAQNDREKALKFYDQAVIADPKDPMVFFKRGDFKASVGRVKDAIADYELMIRVDPASVLARARLAKWYRVVGRDADAVQRVKECIGIEPFNDQFRLALMVMLTEMGKPLEAAQAAEDAAAEYGSKPWRFTAGEYWAKVPNWDRAVSHMLSVWQEEKSVNVAVPLVEYLLNKGDVTNAFNVLQASELAPFMGKSLPLKMLRARVLSKSNRTAEAAQMIADALKDNVDRDSAESTSLFMSGVTGIYTTRADQIATLDRLEAAQPFTSWLALKANSLRLRDEASKAKALRALEALTTGSAPDKVKAATWSLLGTESYTAGNYTEARERFERGQKLDADNIELCNNLAYILAVKLGECEKALPFAMKAARGAPQNSGYLDTLGAAQLCGKKCDDAVQTLGLALNAAVNDPERIPVYIHLGKARLCQGDRIEARRLADQARDLMGGIPSVRQQYVADLKELQSAIDSK